MSDKKEISQVDKDWHLYQKSILTYGILVMLLIFGFLVEDFRFLLLWDDSETVATKIARAIHAFFLLVLCFAVLPLDLRIRKKRKQNIRANSIELWGHWIVFATIYATMIFTTMILAP